jgi:hypothetical protein
LTQTRTNPHHYWVLVIDLSASPLRKRCLLFLLERVPERKTLESHARTPVPPPLSDPRRNNGES